MLRAQRAGLRVLLAVALGGLVAGQTAALTQGGSPEASPEDSRGWSSGISVVAAEGGRASFRCPPEGHGGPVLVIVSVLSREQGPFPVRLGVEDVPRNAEATQGARVERLRVRRPTRIEESPSAEPAPDEPEGRPPAELRQFSMLASQSDPASPASYFPVRARLRAVGKRVQVYVDRRDEERVSDAWAAQVREAFESQVYPAFASRWGVVRDVDGDGRFTVLVSSWVTRLDSEGGMLDGFVRAADLDPSIPAPLSNQTDLLYLRPNIADPGHLRTVIAHEYAHALGFCRKAGRARGPECLVEESWLDEALAYVVEDELGFSRSNLDHRVRAFLQEPSKHALVVPDYQSWGLFRSDGERGGAYLFMRWCVKEHGAGLLGRLWSSELSGVANLESATGESLEGLFRGWTIALARLGLEDRGCKTGGERGEGPRVDRVGPGCASLSWLAAGTSARFVLVEPGAAGQAVIVEGPAESRLQVTAIPISEWRTGTEAALVSQPRE